MSAVLKKEDAEDVELEGVVTHQQAGAVIYQIPLTTECKECTIEIKVSRVQYPIDEAAEEEDNFDTVVTPTITIKQSGDVDPCEDDITNYISGLSIETLKFETTDKVASLSVKF